MNEMELEVVDLSAGKRPFDKMETDEKVSIKPSKKEEQPTDARLQFALSADDNKKNNRIYIPESSRHSNILVLGSKHSGKSSHLLPYCAKQDISNKDVGCTIVVSKKDMAYTIYALAKKYRRKIVILKPSCSLDVVNDFLWSDTCKDGKHYDYDYINNIIDYKDAIRNKKIVIIDMEHNKYKQNAIRATAMLLVQLQIDMQNVEDTLKRKHFVYIDDAHLYLPFISTLLESGSDYNISTMLFMQGRNQLKAYNEDYSSLIDNNVRNLILMNHINMEDAKYYAPLFTQTLQEHANKKAQAVIQNGTKTATEARKEVAFTQEQILHQMYTRPSGRILYSIINANERCELGVGKLRAIPEAEITALEASAKKERKRLNKPSNKIERLLGPSLEERKTLNYLREDVEPKRANPHEEALIRDAENTRNEEAVIGVASVKNEETKDIKEEVAAVQQTEEKAKPVEVSLEDMMLDSLNEVDDCYNPDDREMDIQLDEGGFVMDDEFDTLGLDELSLDGLNEALEDNSNSTIDFDINFDEDENAKEDDNSASVFLLDESFNQTNSTPIELVSMTSRKEIAQKLTTQYMNPFFNALFNKR